MPPETQETPLDLNSFVELLDRLGEHGIPFAVIGGMAVGAYARLRGETMFSADLDIVTTHATLQELIDLAPALSLEVLSRPQPRSVPVAVMKWRGLEVNVVTASSGLPDAEFVVRGAREFQLEDPPVVIPIADLLDRLGNKLEVRRPKDLPHIDVLRGFVEDEIVVEFTEGTTARVPSAWSTSSRIQSVPDTSPDTSTMQSSRGLSSSGWNGGEPRGTFARSSYVGA